GLGNQSRQQPKALELDGGHGGDGRSYASQWPSACCREQRQSRDGTRFQGSRQVGLPPSYQSHLLSTAPQRQHFYLQLQHGAGSDAEQDGSLPLYSWT